MKVLSQLTALICVLSLCTLATGAELPPAAKTELRFLAAGVPKILGEKANYEQIFQELKGAGITAFMPFSEYQEVPESRSLSWEREFYPQYKTNDQAISAMRKYGIKLLIPASILYAAENSTAKRTDPLKEVISWAGRGNVFGVYSYDEPALQSGDASPACKRLYTRVKAVDATLPVIMIHSSIPESAASKKDIEEYLAKVRTSSQFADIVGFDVYAIPTDLMKVKGPYSSPEKILNYGQALSEYMQWLKTNLPAKKHMMVLQAFCAEDQGHPALLAKMYGDRRPTKAELQDMVKIVTRSNVSVGWWGQSLVKDGDTKFWTDVLDATRSYSTKQFAK